MSERIRRGALAVVAAVAAVAGLPLSAGAAPGDAASRTAVTAPRDGPTPAAATRTAAAADGVAAARRTAPGDVVAVTLESLEPREVRPDSVVTVTAVIRNTSPSATGPLVIRLRRGFVLDTRGDLADADANPPSTTAVAGDPQPQESLTPGQQRRVRYTTTIGGLGLAAGSRPGVYPLALTVQRADTFEELGRVDTLLPYLDEGITGIRVTLLWPLLDRPHRLTGTPAGRPEVFSDDQLARSVSRGGRLDTLLRAAEQVPAGTRLTLVVDPETIEALDRMTAGYRVGSGSRTTTGRGGPAATAWLDRLRTIAPRQLVVATPYADPDVVALQRSGNAALARYQQPDLEAIARVLRVTPSTKVSWPPGEQLTGEALDDVVAQGATAVVLDPTALADTPETGRTPSGVSPLPALSGQSIALVGDRVTQDLIVAGGTKKDGYAGGPRLAEQRLLAELAMITAEAPNDTRTVVLSPPRRWDPPAGYAAALAADVGRLSWLNPVDALQAAGGTEPVDRGALAYPPAARKLELPARQLATVDTVEAQVADFRGALDNGDANAQLGPYTDALRRAGSSAWRTPVVSGQAYADRLLRQIGALRGGVTMIEPATGDYTLASSESPLLVTLENRLDVPVNVRIQLTTPAGFGAQDAGVARIQAKGKRTIRVLASVQRTGTFAVKGRATTPGGGPLGDEVTLSVRSTAYGGLALGITGLAFAVLVGAVLFRLVRRLRARGAAAEPVAAGSPADRSRG